MTPEGIVKNKVKKFLKDRMISYRMIIPSPLGNSSGMSDFIGLLPTGRFIAIETKSEKGRLTSLQKKFLDEVKANKGLAFVIRNDFDIEQMAAEINLNE